MALNQDLFSLLPESLIIIILSLLPLKDAVRTSVLARSWRNLWHGKYNIEINERHFDRSNNRDNHHNNHSHVQGVEDIRQYSCIDFGRSWLEARNNNSLPPPISAFTLAFSDPRSHHLEMRGFIKFALDHGTTSLELDFSGLDWDTLLPITYNHTYQERFDLPQIVYEYNKLESLKLVSCRFRDNMFKLLGHVLKSVSLGWVEIANESTLSNLIKSCPLLESLILSKCFGVTVYVIESNNLKCLVMDKCVDVLNFSVSTPNLKSFKYCGGFVQFGWIHFPLLEDVDLDFGIEGSFDVENADDMIRLLSTVYMAKSVRVCAYVTQSLFMSSNRIIPVAHEAMAPGRVRQLTIKTAFHEHEAPGILYLINSYPLLEKLRFEVDHDQTIFKEDLNHMAQFMDWDPKTFWSSYAKPLHNGCVKRKLKHVEINGFRGSDNERNIISFFLFNGNRVLRTLVLRVPEGDHDADLRARNLEVFMRNDLCFRRIKVVR